YRPATTRSNTPPRPYPDNGERSLGRWNNRGRSDSAAVRDRTSAVGSLLLSAWIPFPGARSFLHLSVESTSPGVQRRLLGLRLLQDIIPGSEYRFRPWRRFAFNIP